MLNKMLLIGNVGRDPEMRYTPSGSAVTSFSLAVNRRYTPQGGEMQEETEWFDVTAWNRLAETCNNYVTRGMKVYVEGRLRSRSWVGQDGQTRFRNEIVASTVTFLTPRGAGGGYGGPPPGGEPGGYGGGAGYGGGGGGYGADGEYGGAPGEPSDADDLPW
ncbi:MAG: single-stranded DNA-binding protein [Chloroflexi bacterium]|nr:single-stranded DNA-binding protein [Chloroflexota bacterium]